MKYRELLDVLPFKDKVKEHVLKCLLDGSPEPAEFNVPKEIEADPLYDMLVDPSRTPQFLTILQTTWNRRDTVNLRRILSVLYVFLDGLGPFGPVQFSHLKAPWKMLYSHGVHLLLLDILSDAYLYTRDACDGQEIRQVGGLLNLIPATEYSFHIITIVLGHRF